MSILLEALRKSEKIQHSRDIPTIYEGDHPGPVSETIATVPLTLLLVATLFITGWLVWRQYQLPILETAGSTTSTQLETANAPTPGASAEPAAVNTSMPAANAEPAAAEIQESAGSPQSAVVVPRSPDNSATPSAVDGSSTVVNSKEPDSAVADTAAAVTTPVAAAQTANQTPPGNASADVPARQQRTPMESYQAPADNAASSKTVGVEPSGVTGPAATSPAAQTPNSDTGKKTEPVAETRSPEEPAPISYWDLPDSIRAELPEIKFSVLVYANKPADRFALINGVRMVEGDSPQAGLTVKEIRRDGVVFSYRLYQFLIIK